MDIRHKILIAVLFNLLIIRTTVLGYPSYQDKIPNGDSIPHSCKQNYIWRGVGHLNYRGGGSLNQFGKDFLQNGKSWNQKLCQLDSDGDGLINGEELGDPDCVWKEGTLPKRSTRISHPGICDPFNDEKCKTKNEWVDCSIDELKCNATTQTDVMNITLRLDETKVPGDETTYMCTLFDLPADRDYHVVATKPHIDNQHVMHHAILYGCPDDNSTNDKQTGKAYSCGLNIYDPCNDVIAIWTVGSAGECAPEEYGIRIGPNGYKRAVLQIHWHNPDLKTNYVDSSGLILFYTSKLRPNNAAVMWVGNGHFELPPGKPEVTVVGTCSENCSKKIFKKPFFVSAAMNHMHYLGFKQKTEVFRGGTKIAVIANEEDYNYDSPKVISYNKSVEIRPGDEIITTCGYKTTSKVNSTYFGWGTNDEMCYVFMVFYPIGNVNKHFCGSYGTLPICQLGEPVIRDCNVSAFQDVNHDEFVDMRQSVMQHCINDTCSEQCISQLDVIRRHSCMNGDVGDLLRGRLERLRNNEVTKFYKVLDFCGSKMNTLGSDSENVSGSVRLLSCVALLVTFCFMLKLM